jgi:hypothetical protein
VTKREECSGVLEVYYFVLLLALSRSSVHARVKQGEPNSVAPTSDFR